MTKIEASPEQERLAATSAVRAVFAVRDYRVIWAGAMASNMGTWMQNVTLGAFAYELTKSPTFVGITAFAQLGPMLVLSLVGGMLADAVDRRRMLLITQTEQMIASFVLAAVAFQPHPSRIGIVVAVFAVGIGAALNGPAWLSMLPELVPKELITSAISLNSTQMNAARVVGPAIGGLLYASTGAGWVFTVNAVTYLFAIVSIWMVHPPARARHTGQSGWSRFGGGMVVARRDPLVRRILITVACFSFFSLVFLNEMPTVAARNLGMNPKSLAYGLLYACFGVGAVTGAASVATVFHNADIGRLGRRTMAAFAVTLGVFALLRTAALAYPVALVLGFVYFTTITSMNTTLQKNIDESVRGRVMALWALGWGGMIPLGVLAAAPIIEATSVSFVLLYGAVIASGLSWYFNISHEPFLGRRGERSVRLGAESPSV